MNTRPSHGLRAAEQRDEVAPDHSITSSARSKSEAGVGRLDTAMEKNSI
jgi:hypothetical protein